MLEAVAVIFLSPEADLSFGKLSVLIDSRFELSVFELGALPAERGLSLLEGGRWSPPVLDLDGEFALELEVPP